MSPPVPPHPRALNLLMVMALALPAVMVPVRAAASANTTDALYEKVFGRKRPATQAQRASLPVYFDGTELGQVPGMVALDPDQTSFDMPALLELLRPLAQTPALDALAAQAKPDGSALPAALSRDGITVAYDPGPQLLRVIIPAIARQERQLAVIDRSATARSYMVVPQADFSAQMNMRAAIDYLSIPSAFGQNGLGPLAVSVEPALNWRGWVVEGEAYYREDGVHRFSRGPVRLVRDVESMGIRAQLGDLSTPVTGNQVGRAVAGLSIAKNFSIRPYDLVQPAGSREFVLESPSTVEVLVNGRAMRVFRLEAGPYNLNNFPGASGTNDVRIRITDAFGREQVIDFPFFFDSQLLGVGIQEYGYTIGVPSRVDNDIYRYDSDDPLLSAYHRVGLSDNFTLGLGTQINRRETTVTGEALLATSLGTLGVEPSLYLRRRRDPGALAPTDPTEPERLTGYAGTLRYRSYGNGESVWDNRSLTAQVSWYSPEFRSFGSAFVNDTKLDAAARITQPILSNLTASLGGRYRQVRGETLVDSYGIDLSLRRRLWQTGSLDLTFSHGRETDGTRDTGVYVNTRFLFDGGRQSAGVNVDTIEREQRLDWRYQSLQPVDALDAGLEIVNEQGGEGDRINGNLGYTHQRFEAQLRHNLVRRALNDDRGYENRTQLTAATALVYADGHVGITRPVSNSFAIIAAHPRLDGAAVGVDPVDDQYLAESGALGPAVVPNIAAYLVRPLLLDVPDAPANYDLGNDRPAVRPGYRSGTVVTIGTDAVASVTGILMAADGSPASLLSGVLRPVGAGPDAKEIPFFTNRRGLFRVEGVRPGAWELQVHGVEMPPHPVQVDASDSGDINLGTLTLPPE